MHQKQKKPSMSPSQRFLKKCKATWKRNVIAFEIVLEEYFIASKEACIKVWSQLTFTYSKSTIETQEKDVKSVQS